MNEINFNGYGYPNRAERRQGPGGGGGWGETPPPSPPPRPLASRRGAPRRLAIIVGIFFVGIFYVGIFIFKMAVGHCCWHFFFVMCCYYYSAPEDGEREARRDRPSSMFFVMFCFGHGRYRGDERALALSAL